MFANLGEMVYLYTSMGTTLVSTLVSMLCAVCGHGCISAQRRVLCRAGVSWWLAAGGW